MWFHLISIVIFNLESWYKQFLYHICHNEWVDKKKKEKFLTFERKVNHKFISNLWQWMKIFLFINSLTRQKYCWYPQGMRLFSVIPSTLHIWVNYTQPGIYFVLRSLSFHYLEILHSLKIFLSHESLTSYRTIQNVCHL